MRAAFLLIIFFFLISCREPEIKTKSLQSQIDSLQRKLDNSYRPGLGEFMSDIQVHHAKLWFAGLAENWSLSDFETREIMESVVDIQDYCSERPEVVLIPMIKPALDSIDLAIRNKSISQFKSSFILLTNSCNSCHQATKHEFNVIQIPSTPPFSNQVFQKSTK
jgi:hypothetical protein